MPSETVYVPRESYNYAQDTKGEEQSIGQRLSELIEQGIEFEERGSDLL